MKFVKTLRPTAYAMLSMITLTLSAQEQPLVNLDAEELQYLADNGYDVKPQTKDEFISQSVQDAKEGAKILNFTQNQRNLALAFVKRTAGLDYDVLNDSETAEPTVFTGKQKALNVTMTKLGNVLSQNDDVVMTQELNDDDTDDDTDSTTFDSTSADVFKQFLNQLSPGLYTALPTILFNSANVQNTQIQQRLWAVRAGRSQDNTLAPVADGGRSSTLSGKKVVARVEEPEQKWVTFVDGNGMWSQAQSVNNLPGYNTYAGGFQIGATYEFLKGLSFGPYVGYQGTRVNFNGSNSGGSSATQNSVRFGLLGEYQKGGWYTNAIVGGAYNSVDVNHGINISGNGNTFSSMANGNVAGGEFDSMLGTGYEFKVGKLTFGPATSLQYTYLHLGGTTETGAGPLNQTIGAQNASSLLYTLGGQASYSIDLTQSVKLQPFASLAWQHEFLQNGYNLTSSILGQSYNYQTTNPGRNQYIAGIGLNLVLSKNISAYAICNLINGDQKVFSQAISGGINWNF